MKYHEKQLVALASVKSFGDFVIAHSILNGVESNSKHRVRLIAGSHLRDLHAILPNDVRVSLLEAWDNGVPAIFDVKKRGLIAAAKSAVRLRQAFQKTSRDMHEVLAFDKIGVREKFVAGCWPVTAPPVTLSNIYETYRRFLTELGIQSAFASPVAHSGGTGAVGIFAESRLYQKRLNERVLSIIFDRISRLGLEAKLFVLEGDIAQRTYPCSITIPRTFSSLAEAIRSVDRVISADSLPAHLAEYFGRPVFVALSAPNQYWLPSQCFTNGFWGLFGELDQSSSALNKFLG